MHIQSNPARCWRSYQLCVWFTLYFGIIPCNLLSLTNSTHHNRLTLTNTSHHNLKLTLANTIHHKFKTLSNTYHHNVLSLTNTTHPNLLTLTVTRGLPTGVGMAPERAEIYCTFNSVLGEINLPSVTSLGLSLQETCRHYAKQTCLRDLWHFFLLHKSYERLCYSPNGETVKALADGLLFLVEEQLIMMEVCKKLA